ncbi:MAG: hypothetical protein HC830_14365 [Bacteroidetes bacterium]|nr:hypothetical protein [Bacteroidota bacterium]
MKGSSPRQLAVFISLIATLLTGVVLVIGFFLEIKNRNLAAADNIGSHVLYYLFRGL